MPSNLPQNPVYPVDPTALAVCLPKTVCPNCGTVIALPYRKAAAGVFACPTCSTPLRVGEAGSNGRRAVLFDNEAEE